MAKAYRDFSISGRVFFAPSDVSKDEVFPLVLMVDHRLARLEMLGLEN